MRSILFHGPGQAITLEEIARPACGPTDVVVKVRRCGICGSDIQLTEPGPFSFSPGQLGHEFSGEVVEIGSAVTGLHIGQRVACLNAVACGDCTACQNGSPRFCTDKLTNSAGIKGHQGFSDHAVVNWRCAVPLPDSLSFADGAMIEPMACGVHAWRMAGLRQGDSVLLLGAGTMAAALVYWARRLGAGKVVAASRSAARRDQLLRLGADDLILLGDKSASQLHDELGGAPGMVAECVGKPGMLQRALEIVRPGGTVVSMGLGMAMDPILPAMASFKEARMVFPLAFTLAEFKETTAAFDEDGINPSLLVSEVITLEQVPERIEAIRVSGRTGGKVQAEISG